jgi:hypothetical protein
MKFTMTADEAAEIQTGDGSVTFFRTLKDGDNEFRIAQEPDEWVYFLEHFNPDGWSFPCTRESDCNGCTSESAKMKRRSKRVAFNTVDGEYVNVWKIPVTVADKLKNRYDRIGTVTDRNYIVTRLKTGTGDKARYDFDVEGGEKTKVEIDRSAFHSIDEMLAQAWDEAWGTSAKVKAVEGKAASDLRAKIDKAAHERQMMEENQPQDPPSEPVASVTEEELRAMDLFDLIVIANNEGWGKPPADATTSDAVVDWMLKVQETV